MSVLAPPPSPPAVTFADDDGRARRLRLRKKQILWATGTVLVTTWICTFGVIPAILAIVLAKHVLVAILLMGLGVDASTEAPTP